MQPDDTIKRRGNKNVQQPRAQQHTADALLTQREAADLLSVSPGYLRESSCPKLLLPGNGPRGKPLVRYVRSDVLAWALARRT